MSRNFELLQRVARDDVFRPAERLAAVPRKSPLVAPLHKESPHAEIAKLVQRLFSPAGSVDAPKLVSFSGISRDDRSGWICARAAEALAERADASVCVVDANPWSPQLHLHFAAANSYGLTDALAENGPVRNFAVPLGRPNHWLIPAGSVRSGAGYSLERCRERFAELRESFEHVLISAPALSREAEATFLAQLADGVVLIVEANQSRREAVRRLKEQLESAEVRLLGAVLDQRVFPIPEKLYRRL
jgi:succinoglycan biosynthesis transport protein ExoP